MSILRNLSEQVLIRARTDTVINGIILIVTRDKFLVFFLVQTLHFPLRISSVNVTKSAGNCGFGHIY